MNIAFNKKTLIRINLNLALITLELNLLATLESTHSLVISVVRS